MATTNMDQENSQTSADYLPYLLSLGVGMVDLYILLASSHLPDCAEMRILAESAGDVAVHGPCRRGILPHCLALPSERKRQDAASTTPDP
jgi:hypothetical protein